MRFGKKLKTTLKRDWQLYLFMLLPLAYFIIFKFVPMGGLQLAFRNYTPKGGLWNSPWVGLKNILKFLESYQFERVVKNTFILSVYGLVLSTIIPIGFALIYNTIEKPRFKKITQTIVTLPHFISVVVLVGIMMQLFNNRIGIYGIMYEKFFGEFPADIFGNPKAFRHLYVWSSVWQNFGWNAIIYIATLSGVDAGLHEAAQLDGASRLQRVWHIDLPYLTPTIIIMTIMGIGNIMSVGFEKAFLMQNNLNLEYSELISTYVYSVGLSGTYKSDFSYATAIDLFNAVLNLVLIFTANKIASRVSDTSLW
ncbi:MAG: sugar ABC transporter permease [Lachnospiraceae bacterium]|nr:sugar ABC transporter permease [Lachnospiraceae bacterium]